VSGSITVNEANEIYQAGIEIAMERDLFKNIEKERTFEYRYGKYQLIVETYQKRVDVYHNRFILFDLQWELMGVYWDDDSDGILDREDSGDLELDAAQNLYMIAIQQAAEKNRLQETEDGQILISKNKNRSRELAGIAY